MVMIAAGTYGGKSCSAPGCGAFPRGKQFHCSDCHETFAAKSQRDNHEDFHHLILKNRCPTPDEMIKAGLWTKLTGTKTEVWHGRISRIDMQLAVADLSHVDDQDTADAIVVSPGVIGVTEIQPPGVGEVGGSAHDQQYRDHRPEDPDVQEINFGSETFVGSPKDLARALAKLKPQLTIEEVGMIKAVKFEGAFDFGKHGFHRFATGDTWVITEGEGIKIKANSWASAAREYGDWNNFKTEVRVFTDDDGKTKVALRYTDLLNKEFKR